MEPETSVRPAGSAAPADWIVADAQDDWASTVRWGPRGFAVYARVDSLDRDTYARVLDVLRDHTAAGDDCLVGLWEGWAGVDPPDAPIIDILNRRMLLFGCDLADLPSAPEHAWHESRGDVLPHLAWPADRAWVVSCEVDEELAFTVACSEDAYAALTAALPGQVRRAAWGDPEPMYADDPSRPAEPIDPRGLGEPIPPGAPGWQRYATVGLLGGFGLGGMHDG